MPVSAGVVKGRSQRMNMVTTQRRTFPVCCLLFLDVHMWLVYYWYTLSIHLGIIWVSFINIRRCSTTAVPITSSGVHRKLNQANEECNEEEDIKMAQSGWLSQIINDHRVDCSYHQLHVPHCTLLIAPPLPPSVIQFQVTICASQL